MNANLNSNAQRILRCPKWSDAEGEICGVEIGRVINRNYLRQHNQPQWCEAVLRIFLVDLKTGPSSKARFHVGTLSIQSCISLPFDSSYHGSTRYSVGLSTAWVRNQHNYNASQHRGYRWG